MAVIEQSNGASVPTRPDPLAQKLRRDRIVRAPDLHVPVAVNAAQRLGKQIKPHRRQGNAAEGEASAVLTDPMGAPDEPRGALAGFESDPIVAGSPQDNRMWRPTVSR